MSSDTHISFYLSTYRIHVFRQTLREIGNPQFIRFLVKEDGQSMIMESYPKKDFHSHRVPKGNDDWQLEIRSMGLCKLLAHRLQWDENASYRIPGKTFPNQNLAVFDLSAATPIESKRNQ